MIIESRSIIFTEEELVEALVPLLDAKEIPTSITPKKVETRFDNEGEVEVTYHRSDSDDIVVFNSREVGAVIVNHCIERGVPLPRGSYKELTLRGEEVALIVRIESGINSEESRS